MSTHCCLNSIMEYPKSYNASVHLYLNGDFLLQFSDFLIILDIFIIFPILTFPIPEICKVWSYSLCISDFPNPRGPICFHCPTQIKQDCDTFKVCGRDEVNQFKIMFHIQYIYSTGFKVIDRSICRPLFTPPHRSEGENFSRSNRDRF